MTLDNQKPAILIGDGPWRFNVEAIENWRLMKEGTETYLPAPCSLTKPS
jgi:hypothetical protein